MVEWFVSWKDSLEFGQQCHIYNVLIENQADVNAVLDAAFSNGHAEVVKMLLDQGANLTVANKDGWTPLNTASAQGHTEVVKMLLDKGTDWAVANKNRWTPLNTASVNGHTEVVKMLLEKGTDIFISTKAGQTPIHAAAFGGYSDAIQILLRHGANIRVLDVFGRPPFFYAIKAGDPTSISLLQHHEFLEPEFRDMYGSNALSIAVRCGHEEIIKDLLSQQSLMVEDHFGRTPVWWAHKQGYMHMIEHNAVHPGPVGPSNLPTGYLYACLASWGETYYICKICFAGDFVLCLSCFDIGAHCLVDDHTLTLSDR